MTNTAEMADFILETSYETLSGDVVEEAKKRILDSIAIASGAVDADPVESLRETAGELDQEGLTSVWASDRTTSPPLATALNGAMVRYLDYMDAFLLSGEVPHPSNNVAPSIVSAEYNNTSGRELITALAIAYEIHYQLGKNAPLMDRGWDHGTYVTFAAAAAAGKLFDLDREQLRNALGISGAGHNALRVTRTGHISMWKGMSASNAARNAVYSVMLANNGMEGPTDVFEGQKGWKEIVSGPFHFDYTQCEAVAKTMTKKYMAGTVAQSALDGLDEVVERDSIDPSSIESIHVDTYKRAKVIMGGTGTDEDSGDRHTVTNREEADHSLPYTMAALALDGELGWKQYERERIQSADVQDLLQRVTIAEDSGLTERYERGEMPAHITVALDDGTTRRIEKSYFEGHPARSMSWDRLGEKFASLADGVYTPSEQDAIIATIRDLENRDAEELVATITA